MKKIFMLLFLFIGANLFALDFYNNNNIIRKEMTLTINDKVVKVNIHHLLQMTQMIESNGGRDRYEGRVAKTSYQYEMATVNHYRNLPFVKDFWKNIESMVGRELNPLSNKDAKYVTYIIYFAKLYYHQNLLNNNKYLEETGDIEWAIYKTFWNSSKGASTYTKWIERSYQVEAENRIYELIGSELYASI